MDKVQKILLIDDQPVMSMLMDMLLMKSINDIKIDQVEGGAGALEKLQKEKYDMLLLDVHLPHYSIFDLIPEIRHLNPNIRILVFTASPDNELVQKLKEINVKGFVSKSASKQETVFAVKTVLHGGRYFSSSFSV
jgi:DNA-binding NarL/FixJ family response regulator|tara:strand:+ start:381 stop:785 length:405 start_codon:yes stop_codon:yes gene_type:complete